jgi:hypothetical protein
MVSRSLISAARTLNRQIEDIGWLPNTRSKYNVMHSRYTAGAKDGKINSRNQA